MIDQMDEPHTPVTAVTTTEPTTTAVTTPAPTGGKAREARRVRNAVAAAITVTTWGRDMSDELRRAYAEYCYRSGVDPVSELKMLGAEFYPKASWYKRKLGELLMAGIVTGWTLDHIHADARLDALRKDEHAPEDMRADANRRWYEMMRRRIAHNAPEDAAAICVCTITLANGATVTGCKWAGGGTSVKQPRSGGTSSPNPITEANATLSVESMAFRRAAMQLFTHVTGQTFREDDETEGAPIGVRLSAAFKASIAIADREAEPRPKMIASPADPGDPYSAP